MQLVSYRLDGHEVESWRAGVEHNGLLVDAGTLLNDAVAVSTTRHLLAAGSATVQRAFEQARKVFDAGLDAPGVFKAASLELGPPVPDPDKIICIGVNYADHASETGLTRTEIPLFFAKFRNSR